jgi:homogentisate 1,2-dioxygenase
MVMLLYHTMFTDQHRSKEIIKSYSVEPKIAVGKNIKSLLLKGFELKPADDFLAAKLCLSIKIVPLSCSAKEIFNRIFYKNADADELIFIHKGKGKLRTMLGNIP